MAMYDDENSEKFITLECPNCGKYCGLFYGIELDFLKFKNSFFFQSTVMTNQNQKRRRINERMD